jgi:hypothetical protein
MVWMECKVLEVFFPFISFWNAFHKKIGHNILILTYWILGIKNMCVLDNHMVCKKASILVVEYNEQLLLLLLVECYKLLMLNAPKDLKV